MRDQGSRFYPCPHAYSGEWCGGIVVYQSRKYTCQKCGWQWEKDGHPVKDQGVSE